MSRSLKDTAEANLAQAMASVSITNSPVTQEDPVQEVLVQEAPIAIMNFDDDDSPSFLFKVPDDIEVPGLKRGEKPMFGVVGMHGSFSIYDSTFQRCLWKCETGIKLSIWGTFYTEDKPNFKLMVESLLHGCTTVIYDEKKGVTSTMEYIPGHAPLTWPCRPGFCFPSICDDKDIVIPVAFNELAIQTAGVSQAKPFLWGANTPDDPVRYPTALRTVMVKDPYKYVAVCLDSGGIQLLRIKKTYVGDIPEFVFDGVTGITLPLGSDGNQVVGYCMIGAMVGNVELTVVGTSTSVIYVLKLIKMKPPYHYNLSIGYKMHVPGSGVKALAINQDQNILAASLLEGTIVLRKWPECNTIVSIIKPYHQGGFTGIMFLDDDSDAKKGRQSYLLSNSTIEGRISVWPVLSLETEN